MTERRPRQTPGGLQDDETSQTGRTEPSVSAAAAPGDDDTEGTPASFTPRLESDAAQAGAPQDPDDRPLREDLYGEDDLLPESDEGMTEEAEEYDDPSARSGTFGSAISRGLADPPGEADADNTRIGRPIRLEVLEGPDAGLRKRFNGVRMLIGRSSEAELSLTDSSVSRHHVELVQGDEGVLLRDLGSGNGTLVNGERVTERLLEHEDKVAVGKTLILYFDGMRAAELAREKQAAEEAEREAQAQAAAEAEAAAQAEAEAAAAAGLAEGSGAVAGAPSKSAPRTPKARALEAMQRFKALGRKKQALYVGASVAGVAAVGLLFSFLLRGDEPPARPAGPSRTVLTKLESARFHMVAGRFKDAIALFKEAEALSPGSDPQGLGEALAHELAIGEQLDEVERLIEKGELEDAATRIAEIPEGSADAERKREQLSVLLSKRQLEAAEVELGAALDDGDFAQARTVVERFPVERRQELLARIDTAETEWNERQTASEKRAQEIQEAGERRKQQQRAAFIEAAFSAVERKFDTADYDRALLECDRVVEQHDGNEDIAERSRQLKRLIPAFVSAYEDADRKLRQGATETAVRPLKRAKSLLTRIGFTGPLMGILDGKLAGALLASGRAQAGRSDWAGAADSFKEVLQLAPGDERALTALSQLQKKGEELYRQATVQKKNDPRGAAAKLRVVLELVPAESAVGRQAKATLMELRGRH